MVSVNVAQLLQSAPGSRRELDFIEPIADPEEDLHLRGPVRGHVKLLRTSQGILVHSEHEAAVTLECARCLEEVSAQVSGSLDEEFVPLADIRTGLPVDVEDIADPEQPRISETHEIHLDELLRQNLLTNIPFQPLCDPSCAGLCATCGGRVDAQHSSHSEEAEPASDTTDQNPFAKLAALLQDESGADFNREDIR